VDSFRKSLQKIKKELKSRESNPPPLTSIKPSDTSAPACRCLDSNGEYKILYATVKEAEATRNSQGSNLRIYPCPSQKGWHLTKG
jgi:hypothetical protein